VFESVAVWSHVRRCMQHVLQCVAVCCSVLQCVAVCCRISLCVVTNEAHAHVQRHITRMNEACNTSANEGRHTRE